MTTDPFWVIIDGSYTEEELRWLNSLCGSETEEAIRAALRKSGWEIVDERDKRAA